MMDRTRKIRLISNSFYNAGLERAKRRDLTGAVEYLKKCLNLNKYHIDARNLLGLIYYEMGEVSEALVQWVISMNFKEQDNRADYYLEHTGKEDIERRKLKNAFSHRQMQDDDVIMPPTYKENTGLQSVLNIGAGLLLGAAVIFFLVMPAKIKQANNAHTQEMLQYNEQLNQKNEEIDSLNESIETSKKDKEEAENKLDTMLNSNDSVLNQYAKLVKMLQAYRNNNLAEAVTYYEGFDPSLFTDETVVSIANGVKQDIETNGYQTLEDLAYTMWSAGRMAEALADYQTCLAIRPANPKVIFSMGMIYRAQGETDKAVEMFTQIVTQYADSEQADKARQQLAELAPDNQQAAVPGQSIISQGETAADETAAGSGAETQAAQ